MWIVILYAALLSPTCDQLPDSAVQPPAVEQPSGPLRRAWQRLRDAWQQRPTPIRDGLTDLRQLLQQATWFVLALLILLWAVRANWPTHRF